MADDENSGGIGEKCSLGEDGNDVDPASADKGNEASMEREVDAETRCEDSLADQSGKSPVEGKTDEDSSVPKDLKSNVIGKETPSEPVWENGRYVHTDPETKEKRYWDEASSEWKPLPSSSSDPIWENGRYVCIDPVTSEKKYWDDDASEWKSIEGADQTSPPSQNCEFRNGAYRCKDEKGEELVWVPSASEWRKNEHFVDKDTGKKCYRDAVDNTIYEWDEGKSAWFPLIDEDFLAVYQMQYGIANEDEEKVEEKAKDEEPEKQEEKPTKKRKPENPTWFQIEAEKNTNVYVQGLPLDITEEEFVTTMSKCGLVAKDPDSGKMKVKLYLNKDGKVKGDGRCCYIRRESVDLALQILDGYNLRGFNLKVEPAEFTQKGEYDPTKKPRKKRKQEKEKLKKMQEKLLAWKPDELRGQRPRSDKVVIMKNLFDPETFKKDPKLILDVQTQLKSECEKFGGAKKVVLHDRHPDGVAEVVFKEFENSDLCVQIMNRRLFGDRRLIAELWDGKTKYRIEETEEERKERLGQWEKFLESDE